MGGATDCGSSGAADGAGATVASTVTVTAVPTPRSLWMRMVPPIASRISRTIARPRPVPGALLPRRGSSWTNGWNTRSTASGAMPAPVSVTSMRSVTRSASAPARHVLRTTTSPPASVNFSALPTMLTSTCWRRSPSSRSAAHSWLWTTSRTPSVCAWCP